ncbi:MAG: DinB family protein [Bacteroidota bacterium]
MNSLMEISHRMKEINRGAPWFGTSLEEILGSISYEQALFIPEGGDKHIAHYLSHLVQWRLFCLDKMLRGIVGNIQLDTQEDWPLLTPSSPQEWGKLQTTYIELTDKLIDSIHGFDEDRLMETVPGKDYLFG